LIRSAFNQTLDAHLITGDYCRDYWRLLYRLLEITGGYLNRLLEITVEITVEITGDYSTDYWRLLEVT